jgi:hypothetical protein
MIHYFSLSTRVINNLSFLYIIFTKAFRISVRFLRFTETT